KDSATAYDGLLVELMDLILSQIGETGEYVFLPQTQLETNLKSGFIDSAIMVYDKNALDRLRFTNPLIPTKGKVFVYRAGAGHVQTIDTRKVPSVEETVKGVLSKKTEGGDSGEIRLLGNEGALNYFVKFEDNFCIAVDKNQKNLYEIMNKAVYKIDKNEILSQLEGKWLGVSYPLENRGITESIGILFVIILTAVMAAFYIFYGSNKTLYEELATRMEQVLESKNELQTTFDGVSYYMIEIDLAGKILNGNKAFYKSLETDGSTVIGKELTQVLHFEGEKKKELNELIQYSIKTEEEQKRELSAVRKIYNTRIFPLKNTKGKVIKVLVTIQDITNEKTMERQMIQDNKMIAVGQLAAGVAHEIRNPLGLIRNYCYVLKNNDEQKEKAISVIEKAVDKSGRIIDNLLNFSRSTNHQWENIT
ncbi:MAG: histidine kinase dimerization/phospho-acceptor domain-containing protein, partial [Anaerovorax sp.]